MKPRHAAALALVGVFGLSSCGPSIGEQAEAVNVHYTELIREDYAQMKIAAPSCQAALGVNPFIAKQNEIAASKIFLTPGCEAFARSMATERAHEKEAQQHFALLRAEIEN